MSLRICAAAFVAIVALNQSAHAQASLQIRAAMHLSDPRGEFVRQCAPHMLGRWAHPEEVCGCLHDHAAAVVEDNDLRVGAVARHQRDRRADHRERLGAGVEATGDRPDLHQDRQAHAAMHVRAGEVGLALFPHRTTKRCHSQALGLARGSARERDALWCSYVTR